MEPQNGFDFTFKPDPDSFVPTLASMIARRLEEIEIREMQPLTVFGGGEGIGQDIAELRRQIHALKIKLEQL